MERAQVRSFFLTHTERTRQEKSAQICALFVKLCLLLELIYDTIIVSKTSVNRWNQGVFRPALFGFAAVAASRYNASCDGSGPRGLGFESRHSDQKSGIRKCGFRIFMWKMERTRGLLYYNPWPKADARSAICLGFESRHSDQKTTDSDRNLSFSIKCAFRRVKFASQVKVSCGQ